MIIPDLNLLLYAYNSGSPYHGKAVTWWQKSLSEGNLVGLAPVVVFGFLRIATNTHVFHSPITLSQATHHVRSWLARRTVQMLEIRSGHVEQVCQLVELIHAGGALMADAQIAALALEYKAVVHTADSDFARFPDLKWFNPITGMGSRKLSGH